VVLLIDPSSNAAFACPIRPTCREGRAEGHGLLFFLGCHLVYTLKSDFSLNLLS
jgi:hypothetical protein